MPTPIRPLASISPAAALVGAPPGTRLRDRVRERSGEQDLLVVRIGSERFAVPLEAVDELVEGPQLRHVPGAPENLLGLLTLGDAMLPLYSPLAILGAEPTGEPVALVMRGGKTRIAIAVDDADDVISVALAEVIDAPRSGHHDDVVLGVIWNERDLLTLLDARAVVGSFPALSTEGA